MWIEYLTMYKSLEQQLLGFVNAMYMKALNPRLVVYVNFTTQQLLSHIYATYIWITSTDLYNNNKILHQLWDPNLPIENFFKKIERAIDLSFVASSVYTPEMVLNISYQKAFNTGLFADACQDWHHCAAFKTGFSLAHQELMYTCITTQGGGYH